MHVMSKPLFGDIDAFIFDFDGVLTDNKVYLNQDGEEFVRCSRADGLAFDVIRKLDKPVFILSTEKNKVVAARAKKLKVPVIYGVSDKVNVLNQLAVDQRLDLSRICYIGNDLNDLYAMQACGYAVCPNDAHTKIQGVSNVVLDSSGGEGVARELFENIFNLNFVEILNS